MYFHLMLRKPSGMQPFLTEPILTLQKCFSVIKCIALTFCKTLHGRTIIMRCWLTLVVPGSFMRSCLAVIELITVVHYLLVSFRPVLLVPPSLTVEQRVCCIAVTARPFLKP